MGNFYESWFDLDPFFHSWLCSRPGPANFQAQSVTILLREFFTGDEFDFVSVFSQLTLFPCPFNFSSCRSHYPTAFFKKKEIY
jgi:hypothetical protein